MEHQGMLLFLSDVKVTQGEIRPSNYENIGDCYTTNESAVRYCVNNHKAPERIFVFATKKVQSTLPYDTREKQEKTTVMKKEIPIPIFPILSIVCVNGRRLLSLNLKWPLTTKMRTCMEIFGLSSTWQLKSTPSLLRFQTTIA